jgi:hypothetical protein
MWDVVDEVDLLQESVAALVAMGIGERREGTRRVASRGGDDARGLPAGVLAHAWSEDGLLGGDAIWRCKRAESQADGLVCVMAMGPRPMWYTALYWDSREERRVRARRDSVLLRGGPPRV